MIRRVDSENITKDLIDDIMMINGLLYTATDIYVSLKNKKITLYHDNLKIGELTIRDDMISVSNLLKPVNIDYLKKESITQIYKHVVNQLTILKNKVKFVE